MRSGRSYEALVKNRGVLRRFETELFRTQPEIARNDSIFIVGNRKTILFADLPDAQLDADSLAKVAEEFLSVERAPRDDGERTIVKLMTGEFRILHFAAHGQFDPDPMQSGVVVSDLLRITPDEVAKLPVVPELVFLNCCYLGKIDAAVQNGPDPRLAASLAEGFIQAGVRAVIAAGWAVDDEAVLCGRRVGPGPVSAASDDLASCEIGRLNRLSAGNLALETLHCRRHVKMSGA